MIGLPSLMVAVAAAQPVNLPTQLIKPELAAEGIKGCGFLDVRLKFDPSTDEQVIEVSHVSKASELELRCVAQHSLASSIYVNFPEPLNQRYQRVYWKLSQAAERTKARAWLDRRGLLEKVPTYEKGKTDDLVFARKLEGLCGPSASGAFVRKRGSMTFDLGTPEKPRFDEETFTCLMNASSASGFPIGFVGNEYYPKKH